jgi:hypothetical protein
MKKIFYYLIITDLILCITSCAKDESIGQTPIDSTAPASVSDPVIENLPGGAKISYTLPKETDISYVRAEYLYKGEKVSSKSSIYKNYIEIEGFGNTDPVEVKLYTVDHSNNSSQPVTVTINPLTPPVYSITQSFVYLRDFGGFNLTWENPTNSEIVISVLLKNDDGKYYIEGNLYSSDLKGNHTFHGYKAVDTDFALCVHDKYMNYSDTIKFNLTPLFEEELSSSKFARVLDIPADDHSNYPGKPTGWWNFEHMWDGITYQKDEAWHTEFNTAGYPIFFTIDLGLKVKLSRFKMWQRYFYRYIHMNPKTFEVWGANDYVAGQEDSYWRYDGGWKTDGHWEKLGSYEIIKPSGLLGSSYTTEDDQAAMNGHEFSVPIGAKPCRYVRFVILTSWNGGGNYLHIEELKFYGDDTIEQ